MDVHTFINLWWLAVGRQGRQKNACPNLSLSILGYKVGRVHLIWTYVQIFVVFSSSDISPQHLHLTPLGLKVSSKVSFFTIICIGVCVSLCVWVFVGMCISVCLYMCSIPGVPKKASPQIQNKKCFSQRVNVRELKKMSLVKVIDLRVIHLLRQ